MHKKKIFRLMKKFPNINDSGNIKNKKLIIVELYLSIYFIIF